MSRKEKKFHFIYKTTNLLSGKYYIGMHSTDNLEDGYLGSGKRLRYSINKYGVENHKREILEFVESRMELIKIEKEIVDLNEIAKDECMNLIVGGEGSFDIINKNKLNNKVGQCYKGGEATSLKFKEDEEFRVNFGKNSSKKLKIAYESGLREKKIFYDWSGKKHTDNTKQKISESKKGLGKGEENSQFGTCWITNDKESKKIKKEELENFIQQGWKKGRKMNFKN